MKSPSAGSWPESRLLSCINPQLLEAAFAILAGFAVVVLHARFHWPLKLPGHHGLEWMATLIFVRRLSTSQNAASLTALSAAAATSLPVWGFHDTSAIWAYLLSGLIIDLAYRHVWLREHLLPLALAAGLTHALKPLLHWAAASGFGFEHGSLRQGLAYPLILHFGFGTSGAITGGWLARLTRKVRAN